MPKFGKLAIVCHSDTGLVRDHNEDCVAGDVALGAVVLADGMGGYQAGEVASEIAVQRIMQELHERRDTLKLSEIDSQSGYRHASLLLQQAVLKANQAIYRTAQQQPAYHGMGTTVVAALFYEDRLSVAHVGDSRLYRLRGDSLAQVTRDHSVLQELIDHGFFTREQARHAPNRNLVTRALGVNNQVKVDLGESPIESGDIYLLCSDGLNDMLEDATIQNILQRHYPPLEAAGQQLIQAANAQGGEDNVSVILVQVPLLPVTPSPDPRPQSWWQRLCHAYKRRF